MTKGREIIQECEKRGKHDNERDMIKEVTKKQESNIKQTLKTDRKARCRNRASSLFTAALALGPRPPWHRLRLCAHQARRPSLVYTEPSRPGRFPPARHPLPARSIPLKAGVLHPQKHTGQPSPFLDTKKDPTSAALLMLGKSEPAKLRSLSPQSPSSSEEDFENSLDSALRLASSSYFHWAGRRSSLAASLRLGSGILLATLQATRENGLQPTLFADDDARLSHGWDSDGASLLGETAAPSRPSYHLGTRISPAPGTGRVATRYAPVSVTRRLRALLRSLLGLYRFVRSEFSREWRQQADLQRHAELQQQHEYSQDESHETGAAGAERLVLPRNARQKALVLNAVLNAKYNPVTFVPVILYEQFKFFFNLYFLLVALSQAVPQLRIGYLSSYIVPLAFVLLVTMLKEAGDDIARRRRDIEQNNEQYEVLNRSFSLGLDVASVPLKNLKVGDLVRLHKDMRVPADLVLLHSSDPNGEAFIKTDQLDGETDWKLRVACPATQKAADSARLVDNVSLVVAPPTKSIHSFQGKLVYRDSSGIESTVPLTVDQTLWANTVLASGTAVGIVVYTGIETRQLLNTTMSGVKTGLLEIEINSISKILCVTVFILSVALVLAQGFPPSGTWYIDILRFLILFSTIIPVSLRVNLDLAKSVYASQIQKDADIPGTVVRTSTIPEDLGRIEYLLSDKTGTLTQNDMEMKKLHLGAVCYAGETLDIVAENVGKLLLSELTGSSLKRRDLATKVCDFALVLALCHNVTPSEEDGAISYQAASPDEIAIVKFCEQIGLKLLKRDRHSITLLHSATSQELHFDILYNFPFNSDTKRMGIVVKDVQKDEVWFMEKGADTVMTKIVNSSDWLDEETSNMAREGLRTLVIGRKRLSVSGFQEFANEYEKASLSMHERDVNMQRTVAQYLETNVELLGLTGVEDKLQKNVKTSIELLRNAGVKIWMLTGDKVETAKCVAISAKLISRGQFVHQITKVTNPDMAMSHLDQITNTSNSVLLIDGESLAVFMKYFSKEFFDMCILLPAVIACRCTPQQKADIALAIKKATGKRVCCIGDGGNDVSMIQCADVGVGIVGKEGKQASLSADFSIDQFHFLLKLLLWHGRNSYKRSAKLAQFIIHRGLIISVAQAIYSISSSFEPLALYQGWLMVGYSTLYTMAPVFSLTLDQDVDVRLTKLYPELYKELTLGKSLSYKSFFMWVAISLFQGSVIQLLSQAFQTLDEEKFKAMVSISFTTLILNELVMVAFTIRTWNKMMFSTIVITFMIYVLLVPFLDEYFDLDYITSVSFCWQAMIVLVTSLLPVWLLRTLNRKLRPPSYAKVQQH
ncbi:phospholipid-translocating P-type ATPase [Metschnikowia bicuspidata var. bicuspidata NRRL YB-4993]|uniref:Phospholipid-transporting ATPase n=1 Tax=Metschnikowia bicuspidata var. bicuspidata NRRL YB-4993 TaxID=869754 RepID=A0A1A0HGV4_9ASCO|nr:phospholipid-translocating P-type ATPase [Metschnikowia bicuspidata var. bicuspidata NRRL YB-4993]OBA23112.1 phospholipid-translocating P-type ATPase [Metschnikowia bicuspidata var. bicuspidata NRRL YB-4993]